MGNGDGMKEWTIVISTNHTGSVKKRHGGFSFRCIVAMPLDQSSIKMERHSNRACEMN
jgi:hypothetical protein